MDYDTIKLLAKSRGVSPKCLVAMSIDRDPFYIGKPAERAAANWFGQLWQRFGFTSGVHLRRIHYRLVSQSAPLLLWFGKPYENTETCWQSLIDAAASARYLRLVGFDAFIDQRNPDPLLHMPDHLDPLEIDYGDDVQDLGIYDLPKLPSALWSASVLWSPRLPSLPSIQVRNFEGRQRYHLEIWAEKTTMNDVLASLCWRYDVTLMGASGELSITQVYHAAQRIIASGKPARILYLSDFDPAGQNMPVAAARKLEWFASSSESPLAAQLAGADIRLRPVALTEAQCIQYALPRTPIKESESRRAIFETRYGAGATELDALEALHPGRLAAIMREALRPYWDEELDERVRLACADLLERLEGQRRAAVASHQEQIAGIRADYDALYHAYVPEFNALEAEFAPRLQALNEQYAPRLAELNEQLRTSWEALQEALREEADQIDPSDYPIPEAKEADEGADDALYASERDYFDQLDHYKRFQQGASLQGGEP